MDPATPPLAPVNNQTFPPPNKPAQGMSGCLKILLIVAGFLALCMLIVGIIVWQIVSWLSNMVQPTPATFTPLAISAGEKQDVDRILQGLTDAKQKGLEFDEYVTPTVFNGVLERILQAERDKGKTDVPLGVRAGFENGSMTIQFSAKADQKQLDTAGKQGATIPYYMNGSAKFDLEIVDGAPKKIAVQSLKLGGREAPALILWVIRTHLDEAVKQQNFKNPQGENPFGAIKLLKREGDRLHLILDGKKIPD